MSARTSLATARRAYAELAAVSLQTPAHLDAARALSRVIEELECEVRDEEHPCAECDVDAEYMVDKCRGCQAEPYGVRRAVEFLVGFGEEER